MSTHTKHLAVIGDPVAHSLSPLMQQTWIENTGFEGSYEARRVSPAVLGDFVRSVRDGALDGFNVTLPHKRAVMDYLDDVSETAQETGAVNTVVRTQDGRLAGHNTDVEGIRRALAQVAPGWRKKSDRVILIGAGGAARAALSALSPLRGRDIVIANRTLSHAEGLARDLCPDARILSLDQLLSAPLEAGLVINASSAGLAGQTPLRAAFSQKQAGIAFDCVYLPADTEFLKCAKAASWKTCDGLWMLIHQGAAAFELWWGRPPRDPHAIRATLLQATEETA